MRPCRKTGFRALRTGHVCIDVYRRPYLSLRCRLLMSTYDRTQHTVAALLEWQKRVPTCVHRAFRRVITRCYPMNRWVDHKIRAYIHDQRTVGWAPEWAPVVYPHLSPGWGDQHLEVRAPPNALPTNQQILEAHTAVMCTSLWNIQLCRISEL